MENTPDMVKFGKFACASMAALCLHGYSAVRADAGAHMIGIVCEDVRLAVLCDELAQALSDKQPERRVEVMDAEDAAQNAHLTLRFVSTHVSDSVLSGHLSWRESTGKSGTGTAIDLTVMDATINDEMLRDYARQLLSFTDLPL
jgi:hypothetical protein